MNRRNPAIKLIASTVVFIFFITSLGITPDTFAAASMKPEVSSLTAGMLAIPAELGQVTDTVMGDPKAPAFIHIQSAHGNYQAEKNIEKLLGYIEKNSSVKLMLLEGAADKLHPELFRLFPKHPDFNRKVTDKLMQEGYLTGPESFLIESTNKTEGWGMEDLDAYKKDREAFISVVKKEKTAEKFLGSLRATIDRRFSSKLNKDLLNLVRREEAFGSGTVSFEGWLKVLGEGSKKYLKTDLSDAFYQDQYPFLIRYFRLQAIGSKIDREKARREADSFLNELARRKVSKEILGNFKTILQLSETDLLKTISRTTDGYSTLRRAFDLAFDKLPKDFSMAQWPNWALYAQYIILMQEMEGKCLHEETVRLKDKIQTALAKTVDEKEFLAKTRELYLLRRLFSLELTRPEYEELAQSKEYGVRGTENEKAEKSDAERRTPPAVQELYDSALDFYSTAVDRENKMFANALKRMNLQKQDRAVIITGGFHADGLKKLAQERHCSYVQITPRIAEVSKRDHEVYLRSILGTQEDAVIPAEAGIQAMDPRLKHSGMTKNEKPAPYVVRLSSDSNMSALLGIVDHAQRVAVTGAVATKAWLQEARGIVQPMINSEDISVRPVLIDALSQSFLAPASERAEMRQQQTVDSPRTAVYGLQSEKFRSEMRAKGDLDVLVAAAESSVLSAAAIAMDAFTAPLVKPATARAEMRNETFIPLADLQSAVQKKSINFPLVHRGTPEDPLKIVLIIPRAHSQGAEKPTRFPVGLMSMASCLRDKDFLLKLANKIPGLNYENSEAIPNIDVKIVDLQAEPENFDLESYLKGMDPDIVGISAVSQLFSAAGQVSKTAAKVVPQAIRIIGGVHISAISERNYSQFESAMDDYGFQIAVIREGEEALSELVLRLARREDITVVPGIVIKENNNPELYRTADRSRQKRYLTLDEYPFPAMALDLLNRKGYEELVVKGQNRGIAGSPMTSRGCPFMCIFCCSKAIFSRLVEYVSAHRIFEELKYYYDRGITAHYIMDDNLCLKPQRIAMLADLIEQSGIRVTYGAFAHANSITPELARNLRRSGCENIALGVESGDEVLLKNIGKQTTVTRIENATRYLQQAGVNVKFFLLVGLPGQDWPSIKKTAEIILKDKPNAIDVAVATPYPGSELYGNGQVKVVSGVTLDQLVHIVSPQAKIKAAADPNAAIKVLTYTDAMTSEEIARARDLLNKLFIKMKENDQEAVAAVMQEIEERIMEDGQNGYPETDIVRARKAARQAKLFSQDDKFGLEVVAKYNQQAVGFIRKAIGEAIRRMSKPPQPVKLENIEVSAKAPVRLDIASGRGTDLFVISMEKGGQVLNAAITLNGEKPIKVTVKTIPEHEIRLRSIDRNAEQRITALKDLDPGNPEDPLRLYKAALIEAGIIPESLQGDLADILENLGGGLEINGKVVNVATGSGLGISSILAMTLIKALYEISGRTPDDRELIMKTESLEYRLGSYGGWQDSVGGAFGGIKWISADPGNPVPEYKTLDISPETLKELESRIVLYYTGRAHFAGDILGKIVSDHLLRQEPAYTAMQDARAARDKMLKALVRGDIGAFGALASVYWEATVRQIGGVQSNKIDEKVLSGVQDLVEGGKASGAGGGGFFFFIAKKGKTEELKARLKKISTGTDALVYDFAFDHEGITITKKPNPVPLPKTIASRPNEDALARSEMRTEAEEIKEIVEKTYGLQVKGVPEVLTGGPLGKRMNHQPYVIKTRKRGRLAFKFLFKDQERARYAVEFMQRLREFGLPVPELVRRRDVTASDDPTDVYIMKYRDAFYVLETFLAEGIEIPLKKATEEHFREVGRLAARIQNAVEGFKPRHVFSYKTRRAVYETIKDGFPEMEKAMDSLGSVHGAKNEVAREVLDRRVQLRDLVKAQLSYLGKNFPDRGLRFTHIHNDLHSGNLKFSKHGPISALFDFNLVQADHRIAEFNNLVFCITGYGFSVFRPEMFRAVLAGYEQTLNVPLTPEEKVAIWESLRLRFIEEVTRVYSTKPDAAESIFRDRDAKRGWYQSLYVLKRFAPEPFIYDGRSVLEPGGTRLAGDKQRSEMRSVDEAVAGFHSNYQEKLSGIAEYPDPAGVANVLKGMELKNGHYQGRVMKPGAFVLAHKIPADQKIIRDAKQEFRQFVKGLREIFGKDEDKIQTWEPEDSAYHLALGVFQEHAQLMERPAPKLTHEERDSIKAIVSDRLRTEPGPIEMLQVGYGVTANGGFVMFLWDKNGRVQDLQDSILGRLKVITDGKVGSRSKNGHVTMGRVLSLPYSKDSAVRAQQQHKVLDYVKETAARYEKTWKANLKDPALKTIYLVSGATVLHESQWLTLRGDESTDIYYNEPSRTWVTGRRPEGVVGEKSLATDTSAGKRSEVRGLPAEVTAAAEMLFDHVAVSNSLTDIPKDPVVVVLGNPLEDYPAYVGKVLEQLNPSKVLIVGNGVQPQDRITEKNPDGKPTEWQRIQKALIAINPLLVGKILADPNDVSMNTGQNIESVILILNREGLTPAGVVLVQAPQGLLVSQRIFEKQWAEKLDAMLKEEKIKAPAPQPKFFTYAAPEYVAEAKEFLRTGDPALGAQVMHFQKDEVRPLQGLLKDLAGQVDRLRNWAGTFLESRSDEDLPGIVGKVESTVKQYLQNGVTPASASRSETRLTPAQEKQFQKSMSDLQPKWWDSWFNGDGVGRRVVAAKTLGELNDSRAVSAVPALIGVLKLIPSPLERYTTAAVRAPVVALRNLNALAELDRALNEIPNSYWVVKILGELEEHSALLSLLDNPGHLIAMTALEELAKIDVRLASVNQYFEARRYQEESYKRDYVYFLWFDIADIQAIAAALRANNKIEVEMETIIERPSTLETRTNETYEDPSPHSAGGAIITTTYTTGEPGRSQVEYKLKISDSAAEVRSELRIYETPVIPQVSAVDSSSLTAKVGTAIRVAASTISPLLSSSPAYASEIAPELFADTVHYQKAAVVPATFTIKWPVLNKIINPSATASTERMVIDQRQGIPDAASVLPLVTFALYNPKTVVVLALIADASEVTAFERELAALSQKGALPKNFKVQAFANENEFVGVFAGFYNSAAPFGRSVALITDREDSVVTKKIGSRRHLLSVVGAQNPLKQTASTLLAADKLLNESIWSMGYHFVSVDKLGGLEALMAELTSYVAAQSKVMASA